MDDAERMADAHRYRMRQALSNILRVMRGGGNPWKIIGDIERIAESSISDSATNNERTIVAGALSGAASAWDEESTKHRRRISEQEGFDSRAYTMLSVEHGLCRAALRMVAAELDGNRIEASKASNDMWGEVIYYNQFIQSENEKRELSEIEELTRQRRNAMAGERRAERHNKKALAAANDNADCYVYFVTDGDAIKIGKANNPKSRLGGLQTSHYKPLRILHLMPGDEILEKRLHGRFSKLHIRGEWFRDHPDIREFIARDAAQNDNRDSSKSSAAK